MWYHFLAYHYGIIFVMVIGAFVARLYRLNGYFAKNSRRERIAYTLCGSMAMLFYVIDVSTRIDQKGSTWKSVLFDTVNVVGLIDRAWISCWAVYVKEEDVTWYNVLKWMFTSDAVKEVERG